MNLLETGKKARGAWRELRGATTEKKNAVLLSIADGLISRFMVINRFGVEANPFLQSWVSEEKFIFIKSLGALLAALLLWDIHKQNARLAHISTVFFVVAYSLIVFWNLMVFVIAHV